jgi:hypothetical protein
MHYQSWSLIEMANVKMCNELYRLSTFGKPSWEHVNVKPSPSSLARNGFMYSEIDSTVVCWLCNLVITVNELKEDYQELHMKSPASSAAHQTEATDPKSHANLKLTDPLEILERFKTNPAIASDDQADAGCHDGLLALRRIFKLFKAAVVRAQSSGALELKLRETEVKIDKANPDFDKLR